MRRSVQPFRFLRNKVAHFAAVPQSDCLPELLHLANVGKIANCPESKLGNKANSDAALSVRRQNTEVEYICCKNRCFSMIQELERILSSVLKFPGIYFCWNFPDNLSGILELSGRYGLGLEGKSRGKILKIRNICAASNINFN